MPLSPILISFGITLICIAVLSFLAKRQTLHFGVIIAVAGIIVLVNVWSLNTIVRIFSVTPFKNQLPVYQNMLYELCENPLPADGTSVTSGKILPLKLDARSKVESIDMLLFRKYISKERLPRHPGQIGTLVFRKEADAGVALSVYPNGSKCLQRNYELFIVDANSRACYSELLQPTIDDCPRKASGDIYAVPPESSIVGFLEER